MMCSMCSRQTMRRYIKKGRTHFTDVQYTHPSLSSLSTAGPICVPICVHCMSSERMRLSWSSTIPSTIVGTVGATDRMQYKSFGLDQHTLGRPDTASRSRENMLCILTTGGLGLSSSLLPIVVCGKGLWNVILVMRLWDYEVMRLWGYQVMRLWGYEVMRLWGMTKAKYWLTFNIIRSQRPGSTYVPVLHGSVTRTRMRLRVK